MPTSCRLGLHFAWGENAGTKSGTSPLPFGPSQSRWTHGEFDRRRQKTPKAYTKKLHFTMLNGSVTAKKISWVTKSKPSVPCLPRKESPRFCRNRFDIINVRCSISVPLGWETPWCKARPKWSGPGVHHYATIMKLVSAINRIESCWPCFIAAICF